MPRRSPLPPPPISSPDSRSSAAPPPAAPAQPPAGEAKTETDVPRRKKPNRSPESRERTRAHDRDRATTSERKAQLAAAGARYYAKNREKLKAKAKERQVARKDKPRPARPKAASSRSTGPVRQEIIIGEGGYVVAVREVRVRVSKRAKAAKLEDAVPGPWRLELRQALQERHHELGRTLTAAEALEIREDILTRYNAAAGWPVKLDLRG